jgi:hypothetical protein
MLYGYLPAAMVNIGRTTPFKGGIGFAEWTH